MTFDEMGFCRMTDADYPWMSLAACSFPQSDSQLIRQGNNPPGS